MHVDFGEHLGVDLGAFAGKFHAATPHIVTTAPDRLAAVAEALRAASVPVESQKLVFVPHTTVTVTDEQSATQVLRLHDALDDNDDVLNVYSNFELPAEVLKRIFGHN